MKNVHARQVTLKNIRAKAYKIRSRAISRVLKIPRPHPHNFSNGPSLKL